MFKGFLKIIKNLVWLAFLMVLALVGATFLPIKGNIKAFTVQSGSMEPTIGTGSLIFIKPQGSYQVGDIVTRTTENSEITVTHRIVSQDASGQFITKGDANDTEDAQPLPQADILGKLLFNIPYLGFPVAFARTSRGLVLLIIVPAVLIIFDELLNIKNEIKAIRRKKKMAKKGFAEPTPPPPPKPARPLRPARPPEPARSMDIKIHGIETKGGVSKDTDHLSQ